MQIKASAGGPRYVGAWGDANVSSALPYMQFYVADYLADTAHLSTLEHGAYLLLLMNYWQRGEALPDDDGKLARTARLSLKEWTRIRGEVVGFFEVAGGQWTHKRVERELGIVRARIEQMRSAGKASAQRRLQRSLEQPLERTSNKRSEIPDTEQNRAEQKRKEGSKNSEAKASGESPPQGNGLFDARTDLFQSGLAELSSLTGKTKDACRSIVGKWLKQAKDDAGEVRRTIHRAAENRVAEPIAWIEKALQHTAENDPYRGAL